MLQLNHKNIIKNLDVLLVQLLWSEFSSSPVGTDRYSVKLSAAIETVTSTDLQAMVL